MSSSRLVTTSSATTPAGASPAGIVGDNKPLPVKLHGAPSFRAVFADIAPANNKYMALLFNANTAYDVLVHKIFVYQTNISVVTGVLLKLSLLRVSAFTTGTAVTPVAFDPRNDTLPSTDGAISADHNSSAVSDVSGGTIHPGFFVTNEEMILAAANLLLERTIQPVMWEPTPGMKPLVLSGNTANNKGIAVKCLTSDTAGTISLAIDFSVVPV
jgi:hypothetical protein